MWCSSAGLGIGFSWIGSLLIPPAGQRGPPAPYLAIYEIEADDPNVTLGEIGKRTGTERMRMSEALGYIGDTAPRAIVYNLMD